MLKNEAIKIRAMAELALGDGLTDELRRRIMVGILRCALQALIPALRWGA